MQHLCQLHEHVFCVFVSHTHFFYYAPRVVLRRYHPCTTRAGTASVREGAAQQCAAVLDETARDMSLASSQVLSTFYVFGFVSVTFAAPRSLNRVSTKP